MEEYNITLDLSSSSHVRSASALYLNPCFSSPLIFAPNKHQPRPEMGGGAMRTVSKVSGLGLNVRGASPSVPLSEHAPAALARKPQRSVPTISSAVNEDGKPPIVLSSSQSKIDSSSTVQRPSWELDDWEFSGEEELQYFESQNPPSRVVFGPVPTLEEAREATADRKDALDKIYFSSPVAVDSEASPTVVQGSFVLGPLSSEGSETKAVTKESAVTVPSVPKNVLQEFKWLTESYDVQNVVTSLVSDKNVWDAVSKNPKVMEYCQSRETIAEERESFAEDAAKAFESMGSGFVNDQEGETEGGFLKNIQQQVKIVYNQKKKQVKIVQQRVVEMTAKFSEFVQNVFGYSEADGTTGTKKDANGVDFSGPAMGATFIGLAVMTIVVVLLKRG